MSGEESDSAGRARPRDGACRSDRTYDAVVVGSGFGGTFAAHALVRAGWDVLMVERGDWVPRGEDRPAWTLPWRDRPEYSIETPYHREGDRRTRFGAFHCVGGGSVIYGGVSFRLREKDFQGDPNISGDVGWPFGYGEMLPYYEAAERLLGVRGGVDDDPTDPGRLTPMAPMEMELSRTSRAIRDAADRLGLRPFDLPLAINQVENGRPACTLCGVCDGFACAIGAKNDLATVAIPGLIEGGMDLATNTVAVRIRTRDQRATALECVDTRDDSRFEIRADRIVLAAGALGTPHLLLTSGLDRANPAGHLIGAHLMRHCNGVILGAAMHPAGGDDEFRKQVGIHDFYFGDSEASAPEGKLGSIQQLRATMIGLALTPLPHGVKRWLLPIADRMVALMAMAEDQPLPGNRLWLDPRAVDRLGRPVAHIHHEHSPRDRAARRALYHRADAILREAGAAFTLHVSMKTFSHALGTVRMGAEAARFPVDPAGRLRGVENVWVTDGSVFPTSGAVNPSLTIAANALRIGAGMARSAAGSERRADSGPVGPARDPRRTAGAPRAGG